MLIDLNNMRDFLIVLTGTSTHLQRFDYYVAKFAITILLKKYYFANNVKSDT
jgi:hypothetical protein